MYSDETSCSDCKLELIEKRWTQLLLNWVNKCVHPKTPVKELHSKCLMQIIHKYEQDICADDIDKDILCCGDIEQFIKYKYPILRLRQFWDAKQLPKKLYILHTVLLFHCCVSSVDGAVDSDICANLDKDEQEMILKFCERLSDMEVTANNIEWAVRDAYEAIESSTKPYKKKIPERKSPDMKAFVSDSTNPCTTSEDLSMNSMISEPSAAESMQKKFDALKFKSSITVLPSVVTDADKSSYSELDYVINYGSKSDLSEKEPYDDTSKVVSKVNVFGGPLATELPEERRCQPNCSCSRCVPSGPCCGDPGSSMAACESSDKEEVKEVVQFLKTESRIFKRFRKKRWRFKLPFELNWKIYLIIAVIVLLIIITTVLLMVPWKKISRKTSIPHKIEDFKIETGQEARVFQMNSYICKNGLCEKVYEPTSEYMYSSLSRCTLICMGPQLWPYPIGYTYFSKKIVVLATDKLEYKFQSVPSEAVHLYLAEAFKLFLGELAKLERYSIGTRQMNLSRDIMIKKMYIQMDVESDPDPRIRLDTEESYTIKIETLNNQVSMKLFAASFCGMRHALETLSQLILLDQTTGNLITLSNMVIKDAPSYKYRGLMLDTGRNYIPVPDIMRTIDAMASCKLNTFHWRISDVASFPLYLPAVPQLFEYGSYSKHHVYTKEDVKAVVKRAGVRGIRVLLEVAAPGPVGRAWSWIPEATCPTKNRNFTCNNVLCLRLGIHDSVFDILQIIYSEILEMTKISDVFHLSDSVFSLANCFYLIEEREGFLDKALERLKLANKGFLPKLPIVWYTAHLTKDYEARTWDRYGVQLTEWHPNPSEQFLSRFKVIHSTRWDLSCDIKKQRCVKYRTWQDMYAWKSWRNIEVFTIEGGEAMLWTDIVDSGNLDYHLWPRAAAVAERLWSDIALNGSVTGPVYVRLDSHRWRMVLKSVQVQPIWPLYCSFSPGICLQKIKK
ncbi:probable beta-hexosaminidase fdl [Helicoverpa armigera]|uniref:probable beta-hexosaminidase fdl n=1 Tax=Helicoverpa armigera TaxID=29058 RepID=UPI0030839A32